MFAAAEEKGAAAAGNNILAAAAAAIGGCVHAAGVPWLNAAEFRFEAAAGAAVRPPRRSTGGCSMDESESSLEPFSWKDLSHLADDSSHLEGPGKTE